MTNRLLTPLIFAWNLVSEPKSYQDFLRYSRWQLLGFYLISMIVLAGFWSARVMIHQLPDWQKYTNQALNEFTFHYPDQLTINWSGKELTFNPQQAYTVYFPSFVKNQELNLPNLVAYYHPSSLTNPNTDPITASVSALVIATPTQLLAHSENDKWSDLPLTNVFDAQPFSLTKPQLIGKLNEYFSSVELWNSARWAIVIIAVPLMMLTTLWNGLIQWLMSYLIIILWYRTKISAKQLARLCLPITIVASFVQVLAELIYKELPTSLFSIAFWIILFLVTRTLVFKPKL